jgi:choline dehydrogenase-like flavoprotein
MFGDFAHLSSGDTIDADLCIIGAGAAGISIAHSFVGQRTRVCLVESGGFDFEAETQDLYAGTSIGLPVALDSGRLRMFGGTTNHWGGRCVPFSPAELAKRSWVPYSGWPISSETLQPYYDRARSICGFTQPRLERDDMFRLLNLDTTLAATGDVEPLFLPFAPHEGAIYWNFGTSYRDELEKAENIRVLLHGNLVGFDTDATARHVERIRLRDLAGKSASVSARYFVLCTGGIENARLLLLPGDHAPSGIGNSRDLVGRFFMQHPRVVKAATIAASERFSPLQDFYNDFIGPDGVQYAVGVTLSDQAQRRAQILSCSATFEYEGDPEAGSTAAQDIWRKLRDGRWADDLGTKVWRVIRDLPGFASSAERWVRSGRHPLLPLMTTSVTVELEQLPDPDSRVTLGAERDALGLPRVETDWRISDLERETARQFMVALGAYLGARGLGRLRVEPALEQPGDAWAEAVNETYHYLGTTRMAADPSQGVVDIDCRVHGMDNLFVAGSSVFPTGGYANPTLTITALALRLADRFRDIFAQTL